MFCNDALSALLDFLTSFIMSFIKWEYNRAISKANLWCLPVPCAGAGAGACLDKRELEAGLELEVLGRRQGWLALRSLHQSPGSCELVQIFRGQGRGSVM